MSESSQSESSQAGSVAQQVAAAAQAVPGVTGLHAGVFGEVATYLPGSRVSGVRMSDDSGEVHIIVDINHDLRAVADDVVTAASQAAGVPVSVVVEDVSVGPAESHDAPESTSGGDTAAGEIPVGDILVGDIPVGDIPVGSTSAQANPTRSTEVNNDE
ncbi:hypothetical protein A5788_15370 [Gordonia sp. 852002-50816_SCH5313054-c]|uniref:hypothetical protein n=1 Tax=unclassified Gordonia (in: high G+C Gram-positive bacteria) TaxID=2657482 RepID=UPI0007EAED11|nr:MULTISPECIES: hypothetical protein [unclassified Gordonia (in: high G+C Gram-positive bacteria)]OBC07936.1 hypothetical protein A5786_08740 [Gordonia sp. 852002-50816_SCH5313054-a]OBC15722.1 hypothetical protein A5788_15370 [Gordonia sp. 852002-50816_SCH5313054-c]